jgi:hypothetical protein
MSFFPTSGSVYAADGVIYNSTKVFTQLYIVADAAGAASANIQTGVITASTIAMLRAPTGGQSPIITLMSSTCLSIDGLEAGDVVALTRL